ncbi:MAG: hypothetical protein IKD76_02850 [Clostridia bacterium]|nr:hypothetical protein [Clostridia bacterium]
MEKVKDEISLMGAIGEYINKLAELETLKAIEKIKGINNTVKSKMDNVKNYLDEQKKVYGENSEQRKAIEDEYYDALHKVKVNYDGQSSKLLADKLKLEEERTELITSCAHRKEIEKAIKDGSYGARLDEKYNKKKNEMKKLVGKRRF